MLNCSLLKRIMPDALLQDYMNSFIQVRKLRKSWGKGTRKWKEGDKLSLFFAGYNGARNTGGDVRVEEMIRQVRHLLGDKNCDLTVLTIDPELTKSYFEGTQQLKIPNIFPQFLYQEIAKHDGVISCEGSMFKSKFSDALSTMMAGSLGLANAEKKLSVGYGAEAGSMSPILKKNVEKWCKDSLIICRNKESQEVLSGLGIRNTFGADTAWTFKPSAKSVGKKLLKEKGWDGKKEILAICPINPFWWPVRPMLGKYLKKLVDRKPDPLHYQSLYFHEYTDESRKKYKDYIEGLSAACKVFCQENDLFPVLVAMEKLDALACKDVENKMGLPAATITSLDFEMGDMVSMLWQAKYMVSSRFHAIVTSMPGGVLSCGLTMDERIKNLMVDRGHEDYFTFVDEGFLEDKTLAMLRGLKKDAEKIKEDIFENIPKQLERMGDMGKVFLEEVSRVYPKFPQSKKFSDWKSYLPKLPKHLEDILKSRS